MRVDLVKATELVKSGLSYGDAAERLDLTRNSVAGACQRAGVLVGYGEQRRARFSEKQSRLKKAWWASISKAKRRARGRLMGLASAAARRAS